MIRMLLESGIVAGAFLVLALPTFGGKQRGWIVAVTALGFLSTVASALPIAWPQVFPETARQWNWAGKTVSIVFTAIVAILLIAFAGFRRTDFGLTFVQAPHTGRAIAFAILPFLVIAGVLVWLMSPPTPWPSNETLAFQATLPGLDEEFLFRGLMLALFDRMFPAKANVLNARLGYGAIVVSIVFGLVHAVRIDAHLHAQLFIMQGVFAGVIGFVLVWIRARTQSLALPILTHNAFNLLNYVVPAIF